MLARIIVGVLDWTGELLNVIEVRPQDTVVNSGAKKHTPLESAHVCSLDEFEPPASLALPEGFFHEGNVQAVRTRTLIAELTEICTIAVNGWSRDS